MLVIKKSWHLRDTLSEAASHAMETLTTEFNRYFHNQVQLNQEEKTRAYKEVIPILETLAKYISAKDPRFGSEIIKVGSSFQGLKVLSRISWILYIIYC